VFEVDEMGVVRFKQALDCPRFEESGSEFRCDLDSSVVDGSGNEVDGKGKVLE
jgi:hypothetical protein